MRSPPHPAAAPANGSLFFLHQPAGALLALHVLLLLHGIARPRQRLEPCRGDRLPAEMYGNAIVAEPAANLVSRIVLTRPAVEAGERLGFLPGTLQEKIDPYLRPLYDSRRATSTRWPLPPGEYDVKLMLDDGLTELAATKIKVVP